MTTHCSLDVGIYDMGHAHAQTQTCECACTSNKQGFFNKLFLKAKFRKNQRDCTAKPISAYFSGNAVQQVMKNLKLIG